MSFFRKIEWKIIFDRQKTALWRRKKNPFLSPFLEISRKKTLSFHPFLIFSWKKPFPFTLFWFEAKKRTLSFSLSKIFGKNEILKILSLILFADLLRMPTLGFLKKALNRRLPFLKDTLSLFRAPFHVHSSAIVSKSYFQHQGKYNLKTQIQTRVAQLDWRPIGKLASWQPLKFDWIGNRPDNPKLFWIGLVIVWPGGRFCPLGPPWPTQKVFLL